VKLPFRRRPPSHPDPGEELDKDLKGRTNMYIDGSVIPDRRKDRRPPPVSPGRRADDPIDDGLPVPFVPPPGDA
jgi:hypothetical protein